MVIVYLSQILIFLSLEVGEIFVDEAAEFLVYGCVAGLPLF
jgi:hypothetical protein